MTDQNTFMETIRAVTEIVKTAETPLSREEIAGYFKDMDLSKEQQELIYQYVLNPQEKIHQEKKKTASRKKTAKLVPLPTSVFFRMYLNDLRSIRACTPEEENKLYDRLIAGEEAVLQTLSDQWLSRVLDMARRQEISPDELEDVIQEGNMGVFLALSGMLGSGKKTDFRKEIEGAAKQAMASYIVETAREADTGQTVLAKAALVHEAQKVLAEDLQRTPTNAELCSYTKLPEEELADILSFIKSEAQ